MMIFLPIENMGRDITTRGRADLVFGLVITRNQTSILVFACSSVPRTKFLQKRFFKRYLHENCLCFLAAWKKLAVSHCKKKFSNLGKLVEKTRQKELIL